MANLNGTCWLSSCTDAYMGSTDSSPCDHTSQLQTWKGHCLFISLHTSNHQYGFKRIFIVIRTWLVPPHTSRWWVGHTRWPGRRAWDQICHHWSTEGCVHVLCKYQVPSTKYQLPSTLLSPSTKYQIRSKNYFRSDLWLLIKSILYRRIPSTK